MGASATTAGRVRGAEATTRQELARRIERRVFVGLMAAHLIGVIEVVLLLFFVLPAPGPGADLRDHLDPNAIAILVYLPLATAVAAYLGRRMSPLNQPWVREDRDPDPEERAYVLRTPVRCFKTDAGLWLGGAILFAAVNAPASPELAGHVAWTILLGGVVTSAVAHLLLEWLLRPITEVALAAGPPARHAWPGVEGRLVLAWLFATGAPLLGIITVGCDALIHDTPGDEVARSILVLGGIAFVVGLGATFVVARSVSAPLTAVRKALGRVQAGDLATEVRVSDGSEVGLLQSGFNSMVAGLRAHERTQQIYARHVGEDVARAALEQEPRLGGEVRDVAVLFVDLVGSTAMAAQAPPERVVARLNRFFAAIVDVTAAHGGWVNKFEGDAALCVFGAPTPQEDAAACALAAARELQERLRRDLPGASAGIGLSAGPAVAGWVGAVQRFEYTVIGDPVNVAARLCDLAKRRPERILASAEIVRAANEEEQARWSLDGELVELRGREQPTAVAVPAPVAAPH